MEVHYTHIKPVPQRLFAPNDESDIAHVLVMITSAFRISGGFRFPE